MVDHLSNLPEDVVSHIVGFLTPRDFYHLKVVISSGLDVPARDRLNCYYWWREEVAVARAAGADCASLIRWIVANDAALTAGELVAAAALVRTATYAIAHACDARFPEARADLISCWIDSGNLAMFKWHAGRNVEAISPDTFDKLYLHGEWRGIAVALQLNARAFVTWMFGDFKDIADPEVVTALRCVFPHVASGTRVSLCAILTKYHDWLWHARSTRVATLQTITALHSLEIFKFHPERHVDMALAQAPHQYIEYLVARGLTVEPYMYKKTYDLKKINILVAAQVVQKYQKIMIMILVLIAAIVINMAYFAKEKNKGVYIKSVI